LKRSMLICMLLLIMTLIGCSGLENTESTVNTENATLSTTQSSSVDIPNDFSDLETIMNSYADRFAYIYEELGTNLMSVDDELGLNISYTKQEYTNSIQPYLEFRPQLSLSPGPFFGINGLWQYVLATNENVDSFDENVYTEYTIEDDEMIVQIYVFYQIQDDEVILEIYLLVTSKEEYPQTAVIGEKIHYYIDNGVLYSDIISDEIYGNSTRDTVRLHVSELGDFVCKIESFDIDNSSVYVTYKEYDSDTRYFMSYSFNGPDPVILYFDVFNPEKQLHIQTPLPVDGSTPEYYKFSFYQDFKHVLTVQRGDSSIYYNELVYNLVSLDGWTSMNLIEKLPYLYYLDLYIDDVPFELPSRYQYATYYDSPMLLFKTEELPLTQSLLELDGLPLSFTIFTLSDIEDAIDYITYDNMQALEEAYKAYSMEEDFTLTLNESYMGIMDGE